LSWGADSRRRFVLLGLALGALLLQAVLDQTRAPVRQRDYELKLEAARLAAAGFATVRRHRMQAGAELDLINDPAGTGLVGPEYSLITNARGSLAAKLTSLNPNWAAVVVEYCRQAGLRAGDPVAVALSGSFPAMNIAVYAALEVLKLRPEVVTSIGASMWGANDPEFTWLDIERLLVQKGVLHIRSAAASFGGGDDMGRGLSPAGRRLLREAAVRNDVPVLESANIEEAITRRMAFYEEHVRGRPYRLYINVGGGLASIGSSHNKLLLPNGLSFAIGHHNYPRKGCLVLMAEKGVPIVHLLNIVSLARRNGLPTSPAYIPTPGEGEVFVRESYRLPLAAVILVLYGGLCLAFLAPELRRGLLVRVNGHRKEPA
jgi:poly-gamma-glutamate system protein